MGSGSSPRSEVDREAGVPAELHIHVRVGHGFGMRPGLLPEATWNERLKDWMADLKLPMNECAAAVRVAPLQADAEGFGPLRAFRRVSPQRYPSQRGLV